MFLNNQVDTTGATETTTGPITGTTKFTTTTLPDVNILFCRQEQWLWWRLPRGLQEEALAPKMQRLQLTAYILIKIVITIHFPESAFVSQSSPSYNPSPVIAQHPWIFHSRPLIWCNPSFSVISGTPITPMSCLFAKIKTTASFSSSS